MLNAAGRGRELLGLTCRSGDRPPPALGGGERRTACSLAELYASSFAASRRRAAGSAACISAPLRAVSAVSAPPRPPAHVRRAAPPPPLRNVSATRLRLSAEPAGSCACAGAGAQRATGAQTVRQPSAARGSRCPTRCVAASAAAVCGSAVFRPRYARPTLRRGGHARSTRHRAPASSRAHIGRVADAHRRTACAVRCSGGCRVHAEQRRVEAAVSERAKRRARAASAAGRRCLHNPAH